ncbi:MAG TPA: YdeI/OmpD-associated family protein [Ohtaekwangia sp.]|uniref:YdeI/OmpD-associated family protein n=1 Tax=Ohtaekwangia sp. TaxID=2066019 RepID=UPI002F934CDF
MARSFKQVFKAILENPDSSMDTAYISIPFDVEKVYGTKGQVKVKALFDGHPYRGVLANMGTGCHVILVRKDIRASIGKKVGDIVKVEIDLDTEERVVDIPAELQKVLSKNTTAKKIFDSLSYTNRKEYANWIRDAKKEETREKRLAATLEKLLAGKKNPGEK